MRRLKIMLHGQCFDGAASASLFARFYRERIDPTAEIVFTGKGHAQGPVFSDADFDADEHAVVDFRYAQDPRLGWWFDHHASAFQQPGDEASFRTRPADRFFFDPHARSCTKFLAESVTRTHGWDATPHAELVRWADLIDGAQFDSAEQAIARSEPALKLCTFVEHNEDPVLQRRVIEGLGSRPLAELAREGFVTAIVAPLQRRAAEHERIVRAHTATERGVAFLDLSDGAGAGYNKFLPYLVAPEAKYVVSLSRAQGRAKISVGMNPWNAPTPLTHIATICERYGGGGHAVVGGVTLDGAAAAEGPRIAREIVEELRQARK